MHKAPSRKRYVEFSIVEAADTARATFEISLGGVDNLTGEESRRFDKRDYSEVTMLTLKQAFAKMKKLQKKYEKFR